MKKSLRSLFIAKNFFYPPKGGVSLRVLQNINFMLEFGEVGLFSISDKQYDYSEFRQLKFWHNSIRPSSSNFRQRNEQLRWWFFTLGLRDYWAYFNEAATKLAWCLEEFNPDIVILEELWLYHYLSVVKGYQCPVIFDAHNVESELYESIQCLDQGIKGWLRSLIHLPLVKAHEKSLTQQALRVWACSQDDANKLQNLYQLKSAPIVVPNVIDVPFYSSTKAIRDTNLTDSGETCLTLLFLGTFSFIPNAMAAQILIESVYPKLKKICSQCRLLLVGKDPTDWMEKAAKKDPNIVVTGEVEDVRVFMAAASVMVVPLTKGSGTRFKVLEAFAAGLPVVSTSKGVEGLLVEDREHLLIGNTLDSIIDKVNELWSNPALEEKLVNNAFCLVNEQYSWASTKKRMEQSLGSLFSDCCTQL